MKITGKAHKFGRDIDTDIIIPAQYLTTFDPDELAKHCMEPLDDEFKANVAPGDIIVADENFGCGSSREHAPVAIKGAGIGAIIAKSFARIFYRNAINTGLPIFESPEAVDGISAGDEVSVDVVAGVITNTTTGKTYQTPPFTGHLAEIIEAGGLIEFTKKRVKG
ncbi:MAG: 3-isopropylmalate dehydratase small subunit [Actinomycetota bacterium]|nr:3-isopropylmalate dehydratase small subunit [Actinomycetota bacterium]